MKYIISVLFVFIVFGCEKNADKISTKSSINNTEILKLQVADKNIQPPTPPSIEE